MRLWTKNTSQGPYITRLTNTNIYRCKVRQDESRQDEVILCGLNLYESALYVLQYLVGTTLGICVVFLVGVTLGICVGLLVGVTLGENDGVDVGVDVGLEVGIEVGSGDRRVLKYC